VQQLGGLDVVMANAGVAGAVPLVGGDPAIFERTIAVNLMGVYYTLRAAGPHISHPRGYALAIASLAAAVHAPMMGAYNASKAATEALGNTLRIELRSSGARVGVGYFGFIDTDMVKRGFETRAARQLSRGGTRSVPPGTVPLRVAIDAIERGIERRARRVTAPRWVDAVLPLRMLAQPLIDITARRGLDEALATAREEHSALTTEQPLDSPLAREEPAPFAAAEIAGERSP
jgi:NAD(P)-dependent dehydrogenase (short-subunit alcohol dehydrogenase family)